MRHVFLLVGSAAVLSLSLVGTNTAPGQENGPAEGFVSFQDFVQKTEKASFQEFQKKAGSRVRDRKAFDEMRLHILGLYKGVDAKHSFVTSAGQYVDCIPTDQQPSLRKGKYKLEKAPAKAPDQPMKAAGAAPARPVSTLTPPLRKDRKDRFGNEMHCSDGAIPMRRITLEEITRFGTLEDWLRRKSKGVGSPFSKKTTSEIHRWAHAYQMVNNYGGNSFLNVWSPVPTQNQFSLAQHWYVGGSGGNLQTVEGGWQVYPAKYGTDKAVLFIFWTADDYQHTGCYNLDCTGFVQTSSSWVLGGVFDNYSTSGGTQYEFQMGWYRDPQNGNWWCYLGGTAAANAIGYYPKALYGTGQMSKSAEIIDYGGEVTGQTASGQMGSGAFAKDGFQHAAYQRNIYYDPTAGGSAWANLTGAASDPACYSVDVHANDPNWGTYIFFGGPKCD